MAFSSTEKCVDDTMIFSRKASLSPLLRKSSSKTDGHWMLVSAMH